VRCFGYAPDPLITILSGVTPDPPWDIRRRGRAWAHEAQARWALTPEKLEMYRGKLLWEDDQRLALLGLLLENMGADAAVRLGDPAVWRAAVQDLPGAAMGAGEPGGAGP
jgi:hypothetical protein